jgi:hypothetical protein
MIWMKKQALKKVVFTMALMMPVLGIYRAAQFQFQQKEDAFHQLCRAEMTKLGLNADAARAKYPTPEIHMVTGGCIAPGATGEVVVKGKFAPGTKFFFENDALEVVSENLTAGVYRATLKASPGIPPQQASVAAISPVSGIMTRHSQGVKIGGKTEWTLQAANGWKILAKPQGGDPCSNKYLLQFFRGSEAQPFEKREGTLNFDLYSQSFHFSISSMDAGTANSQQTMESIAKKMMDPNTSDTEREKLMEQMQKVQEQMVSSMQAMVKDPAKMAAQQEQFGCSSLSLDLKGSALQGRLQCSQTVGRNIAVTGSYRPSAQ